MSSRHEVPFLLANLIESQNEVDLVIVCEANMTLSCEPREMIFQEILDSFPQELVENVQLLEVDMRTRFHPFNGESRNLHFNELCMRNAFTDFVELVPSDIVIALDADEVIYKESYKLIKRILKRKLLNPGALQLNLHQFIFRINYQWRNLDWIAPTAALASTFLNSANPSWRNTGYRMRRKSGVHFSWVMDIPSMISKIHNYAHRVENLKFANGAALEAAIKEKVYLFEPERKMDIKVHSNFSAEVFPESIRGMQNRLSHLFQQSDLE